MLQTHEIIFNDEGKMLNFLTEMDETDIQSVNYIDEGEISNITDRCATLDVFTIAKEYGIVLNPENEKAIEETVLGLGCMWIGPVNGMIKAVPIADIALDSLCARSGLYGPSIKVKPTILNEGMTLKSRSDDNKQKVLIRRGQLLAAHSNKYSWLSQKQLALANSKILQLELGDYEFAGGAYSDEITYALYKFPLKQKEILEKYNKKAKDAGEKVLENLVPAILFTTSDTTRSGANLCTTLVTDKGNAIRLGNQLSVPHKNGNTIAEYTENCATILSLLKDSTKRLEYLLDIELLYPENCFLNLVKAYSLSSTSANTVYEDFTITRGYKVTAHSLFWALWNISTVEAAKGATISKQLDVEEKLSRLLFADFKKYDTPTVL